MHLAQLASVLMSFASRLGAGCPSSTSYWPFYLSLAGHMTDLIYAEKDLKEYILLEEAKLSKIKSGADKMEALTSKSAADPEPDPDLAHPVNAYELVKRLNTDWPALEDLVLQNSAADFIANLSVQRQFSPPMKMKQEPPRP